MEKGARRKGEEGTDVKRSYSISEYLEHFKSSGIKLQLMPSICQNVINMPQETFTPLQRKTIYVYVYIYIYMCIYIYIYIYICVDYK